MITPIEAMAKDEAIQVENMKISYFRHSSLIKNIYGECPICHSMQSEDNFCANCGQRLSFKIRSEAESEQLLEKIE